MRLPDGSGNGAEVAMPRIRILLTSEPEGGLAAFRHGELEVAFFLWSPNGIPPLLDGTTWAFVDWILRDLSGLEVCRRLRCDPLTADARVTMVLDQDDSDARRQALRAGADDYILGPLTRAAILDRVMAAMPREAIANAPPALRFADLAIDIAAFQARWQGKPVPLMPNEFRLLRYFVEHPGRVFTRSQLIAALGKHATPIDERTVDVWIGRLRRALRAAGAGDMLRTVRSLGYVLDQP